MEHRRKSKVVIELHILQTRSFLYSLLTLTTYIPAELCKFTAGQKRKTDLDARETSEMINVCFTSTKFNYFFFFLQHTRKLPAERFSLIDKKVREIVQNLASQNMDLGLDCKSIISRSKKKKKRLMTFVDVVVNARILKPKPIVYKGDTLTPANGGWEIGKLYSSPQEPVTFGVVVDESMERPVYEVSFKASPIDKS
jgi:hypothetical protein